MPEQPRRVAVTSPRMRAARPVSRATTREIDEQTQVGEVYMRTLMRAQLRLGLAVIGVVIGLLGGLPLLFTLVPQIREMTLLGIPLPWLVLGGAVYPILVAAAWVYVRQAERTEGDFSDLVNGS